MFIIIIILINVIYCHSQQVVFSTYFGGNNTDWISSLCLDSIGDVYVTGTTFSTNFPVTAGTLKNHSAGGGTDVFVSKFSKTGDLIHSALVGGTNYDGNSQIALDSKGNIIIVGVTVSNNFPIIGNAYDSTYNGDIDIFITKINSTFDSILYSSYLGGNNQDHHPILAVDDSNNIYITGPTRSANFPTSTNAYDREYNGTNSGGYYGDVFICKLDKDGKKLLYSSFIGGSGDETAFGIDVGSNGIAYITGLTNSDNYPADNEIFGANYSGNQLDQYNAYITAINTESQDLNLSVVFGGSADDQGNAVYVDQNKKMHVVGNTSSNNFPTTPNSFDGNYIGDEDIFMTTLDSTGKELLYSSYIGSIGDDGVFDFTIDINGIFLVGGGTSGDLFPVTPKAADTSYNSGDNSFYYNDAVFFMLDPNRNILNYSTYLGGTGDDNVFKLVNKEGLIYIAGATTSSDFPVTNNAYDDSYNGGRDGFLYIIKPDTSSTITNIPEFNQLENRIVVFPNPASNYLNINIPEFKYVEIINLQGKKVFFCDKPEFELPDVSKGVYVLNIITTGSQRFEKLIIE